jgi:hypothetical protein
MKGMVIPVYGRLAVLTAAWIMAWHVTQHVMPKLSRIPKLSGALKETIRPR